MGETVSLQPSFPLDFVAFLKVFLGNPKGQSTKQPGFISKDNVPSTELAAGSSSTTQVVGDRAYILDRKRK